ncbi:PHP domain-containing protein [Vibrio bathopelagicus]|uniref:PHP domain-containing protein n=1 Tax=Vibrio bathopelagicus TaxID=2777577 RepID=UPI00186537F2|nr:hypothetical protein [Vibrio bathopelagicus]
MSIIDIIKEMNVAGVNCIIINDHDTFSLTYDELALFDSASIIVFNAIEFTTKEGIHVIGIHKEIKSIECDPFTYSLLELLSILKTLEAKIILPHPYHGTGVYGNVNIHNNTFEKAVLLADGFEVDNYRYGKTPDEIINKIQKINPTITKLIGSDAHSSKEVSSFINTYEETDEMDLLECIFTHEPKFKRNKNRTKVYFKIKRIQKTKFYQTILNLFSVEIRHKIKLFLNLR